jgi:phosphatidylserine decarboxylase
MTDVSSCVIDALPGQRAHKGDELGYFQYGGSTWCLVLQPGVIASFVPEGPFTHKEKPVPVNTSVAVAR